MSFGEKRGETQMKLSTVMRWAGPVAIVSGVFTMFADLLGLTIYVPGLGEAANTGYQAVGAGVILIALMLLIVGMAGLYAGQPKPGDPRVIEIGYPMPEGKEAGQRVTAPEETLRPAVERAAVRPRREHRTAAVSLSSFGGYRRA
jgi:hypothetical protein